MAGIDWQFTLVLLLNGVMIGLMYALIALGFVLIYKATDAINFAQGEFVMFAGFYRRRRRRSRRPAVLGRRRCSRSPAWWCSVSASSASCCGR